jgi:hypothetical protein
MPNFKLADGKYVREALYTGANNNDRLVCYGQFFYEANSSLTDGTELGTLILHYDITFQIAQPYATDSIADQAVFSLKSVCDNSGTVGVSNITSGTVNDALLVYNTAHAAPSTINQDYVYAGIIDALTDLTLETVGGKLINEGTRVFFKAPAVSIVSDVVDQLTGTSASVGSLSLGRDFNVSNMIKLNRTADGYIDFSDINIVT